LSPRFESRGGATVPERFDRAREIKQLDLWMFVGYDMDLSKEVGKQFPSYE